MIEVFNRYEKKYLLSEESCASLMSTLMNYMELDKYADSQGQYRVLTLYYDTPSSDFIRTSLSRPRYKEKLRLRAYTTPQADSLIYAEVKKKVAGLVNKRRSLIRLPDAYAFFEKGSFPPYEPCANMQVLKELNYIVSNHCLIPAVMLSYERIALHGIGENHGLRISFDRNILSRRHDLRLESGIYGERLIRSADVLMEIKVSTAMPVWLTKLLSEHSVFPSRFSKYGKDYMKNIKTNDREVIYNVE